MTSKRLEYEKPKLILITQLPYQLAQVTTVMLLKAYIAGKPLLSTVDWPSKVCCVVFFAGCNLRCKFCFNAPILEFDSKFIIDLDLVYQELDENRFLIDGVLISGGEPTLQPESLQAIAEWTHNRDLQFGLMTNGTQPMVIQKLLDSNLLDFIAVDIKTIPNNEQYMKITQSSTEILSTIKKTISIVQSSKIQYEFRTTLVPQLLGDIAQLKKILKWVGKKNYVIQNYRPTETVLDSTLLTAFSEKELQRLRDFANANQIATRF